MASECQGRLLTVSATNCANSCSGMRVCVVSIELLVVVWLGLSRAEQLRKAKYTACECVKSIVDELFDIYVKFRKRNDLTEVINGYKRLWG